MLVVERYLLPDMSKTVEELLDEARRGLRRLTPIEAIRAREDGALLVDIRSESQRAMDGLIPGASFIPRNVLEWRLDTSSPWREEALARPDAVIVLICDEGCQSSLAAATLQELGLAGATDIIGGFQAWRSAGLPVEPGSADQEVSARSRMSRSAR
jgi:rhodanese-related sulfurtransferase